MFRQLDDFLRLECPWMVGARDDQPLDGWLHHREHTGDIFVLRRAEDERDQSAGEMLFERLAQFYKRIFIMSRVEDHRRLAAHHLEAGGPIYLSKPFFDSGI